MAISSVRRVGVRLVSPIGEFGFGEFSFSLCQPTKINNESQHLVVVK